MNAVDGAMASEEERVLENLLELQLQEQRDSLATLNDALASDPTNPDLLAVRISLSLSLVRLNASLPRKEREHNVRFCVN